MWINWETPKLSASHFPSKSQSQHLNNFSVLRLNKRTRLEHIKKCWLTKTATSLPLPRTPSFQSFRLTDFRKQGCSTRSFWLYSCFSSNIGFHDLWQRSSRGHGQEMINEHALCRLPAGFIPYAPKARGSAQWIFPRIQIQSHGVSESVLTLHLKWCSRAAIDNGQMPSITGTSSIIDLQLFPK